LYVAALYPQSWAGELLPVLVLVPGGSSDSSDFTGAPYRGQTIADSGFLVVVFDPDGRGHSEGVEDDNGYIHQDGLAAVIRFAVGLPGADRERVGLASFSYGITMAAGVVARYPDLPLRFLIDWEGPADRNDTGGCDEDRTGHLRNQSCEDELFWREREAATFALDFQIPYQRIQSERDHAQPDNAHAFLMIANATAVEHGGNGQAPWTRLNDLAPNTVHSADNPSPLPAQTGHVLQELVAQYAEELFNLP
jgi:pimeloyl-ACP methyl ester carboxylesterase